MHLKPFVQVTRNLSIGFAAGGGGAVAKLIFGELAARTGLAAAMGIVPPIGAHLSGPVLSIVYEQIVWGGIFGMAFTIPALSRSWITSGLIIGFAASMITLFIVFPAQTFLHKGPGIAGLNAGELTPVLVLAANSVWGLVAAWWYKRMVAER